jgi:hypothetical protein
MPIVVVLIALVALVWGAIWSFHAISAQFGFAVATGAAVVVALLLMAAVLAWWRRRQEVAPNVKQGDWTHELARDWGGLRLAAGKRLCDVRLDAADGHYIFADLKRARAEASGAGWRVVIDVKDAKHPEWVLPMQDRRDARKWSRIVGLAVDQKL